MGFFKMLGSVAETLIDQGNRERERRERRQHRANREIVKMYNDSEDGGSNYRDIAKKSVGGNHGWYLPALRKKVPRLPDGCGPHHSPKHGRHEHKGKPPIPLSPLQSFQGQQDG